MDGENTKLKIQLCHEMTFVGLGLMLLLLSCYSVRCFRSLVFFHVVNSVHHQHEDYCLFGVSIIQWALTGTTWSLTCISDLFACVCTQECQFIVSSVESAQKLKRVMVTHPCGDHAFRSKFSLCFWPSLWFMFHYGIAFHENGWKFGSTVIQDSGRI